MVKFTPTLVLRRSEFTSEYSHTANKIYSLWNVCKIVDLLVEPRDVSLYIFGRDNNILVNVLCLKTYSMTFFDYFLHLYPKKRSTFGYLQRIQIKRYVYSLKIHLALIFIMATG